MATTITAQFETRREAEMSIERLVQEYGIERTDIFVSATNSQNTAGEYRAGPDAKPDEAASGNDAQAALNGPIEVSVDLQDEDKQSAVLASFAEFRAQDVDKS